MTDLLDEIFYSIHDIVFSILLNGGWIVLLIILISSSALPKKGSDYFEIAKEQKKSTERKNRFLERYLLLLLPTWVILNFILPNSQFSYSIILALPYMLLFTTLSVFSLYGILLSIIASFLCISKISNKLKIVLYFSLVLLIIILIPSQRYYIYFNLILSLIHSAIEILKEKELFLDENNCVLSNKQIILRNIIKFSCLYVSIIPLIYYIKTKEILWDKITNTHYVSTIV